MLLLGDARQVHLARWSDYLTGAGYEVLALSLEPVDSMPGAARRIDVSPAIPNALRYPLAVPRVKRIAAAFRPDLVNAHFTPNYGLIAALAGFPRWVLSTWGSDIMILPQKSRFHMWRTRYVIERARYITSDAEVMTQRLIELGAPPDRVVTFPFGVDRSRFHPPEHPSPGAAPRILSNRKLEEVYDVATIIEGFGRLHEGRPDARLTIAGSGSLAGGLQAQAAASPAAGAISFIGEVAHGDMPDLLRAHDVYVSMARSDTTSVSLLEAMACGLYPVASDIPANREWLEDGSNGLLVAPGDGAGLASALAAACGDANARAAATEKNRRLIAARADWTNNMLVVRKLFEKVLQGQ